MYANMMRLFIFFFNDTASTEIYTYLHTLSLHDALPIYKRSITLDLRSGEGKALFLRLAAQADVVCENFRPGTMEKWGLGYETLAAANPGIVMLRVSGYGPTGPNRGRTGFGRSASAEERRVGQEGDRTCKYRWWP